MATTESNGVNVSPFALIGGGVLLGVVSFGAGRASAISAMRAKFPEEVKESGITTFSNGKKSGKD